MANTTATYWDINGQSLNTYAFNIESIGNSRIAPPALRGDNIVIPATPGQTYVSKVPDSRVITLGMWVVGSDQDGYAPSDKNGSTQFDTNWRMLRNLIWNEGNQFTLTKRFYVGGTLITASAKAEYAGGLNPTMNGRTRGVFTVDLLLADPYFYSPSANATLVNGTNNVTIPGDVTTNDVTFTISGSRTNPQIVNNTRNSMSLKYQSSLSSGDSVVINSKAFTSMTTPAAIATYNSISFIRHAGDTAWFLLSPTVNTLTLSSDAGIGSVIMSYKAAWV